MKKILLVVVLSVFFCMASIVFAGDFENFDNDYCTQIEDVEYCINFKWLPFGASGAMFYNAEVRWSGYWQSIPVDGGSSLGTVTSRDGKTFKFESIPFVGMFERGKLILLENFAELDSK